MEDLRERIDLIDESIQNLFLERMQIVSQIAKYKKENKLPVYDGKREQTIIVKNVSRIDDFDLKDLYEQFYTKMLEVSKQYQERILKR
ncbi:MAG: chorismate mutase [Bacilli bacterium]|nr:chorismate mutase [Bacilli bacterium]MBN2876370.1 chorismate mutase [Bacilli bacterium]